MALPFVHNPALEAALPYISEEYLGRVTGVEASLSFPGPPRANWYYSAEAEGGAMLDTMVYPLARVAALMGPARRIGAIANTQIPRRLTGDGGRVESAVDDAVSIVLEYEGGQHGRVDSIWAHAARTNHTVIHGRHGAVFLNHFGRPLVVTSDRTSPPGGMAIDHLGFPNCYAIAVPDNGPELDIVAHFVRSIRDGTEPRCGLAINLHIAEQQMKAYESSRTGRILDLTTRFDVWWPREASLLDTRGDWL
jgi:predicted dehydrogenase